MAHLPIVPHQNGFATLENLGIIKVVLVTMDRGHEIETEVSRIMTVRSNYSIAFSNAISSRLSTQHVWKRMS